MLFLFFWDGIIGGISLRTPVDILYKAAGDVPKEVGEGILQGSALEIS